MAVLTGAQVISEDVGLKLENVTLDLLGTAKRVIISKDNTTIVDGGGSSEDVSGRIKQIKTEIENTDSDWDREKLQERLAKLAGGVAVIQVGAATEVELKEKKHRIEDAVSATKAAIEEGVVAGGGTALIRARAAVATVLEKLEGDEATGGRIVYDSLTAPTRNIAENAGLEGGVWVKQVESAKGPNGLDANTGELTNLLKAGIIDPAKVTRAALQNAASIAAMVLTTECLVADKPEPPVPGPRRRRCPRHGRHARNDVMFRSEGKPFRSELEGREGRATSSPGPLAQGISTVTGATIFNVVIASPLPASLIRAAARLATVDSTALEPRLVRRWVDGGAAHRWLDRRARRRRVDAHARHHRRWQVGCPVRAARHRRGALLPQGAVRRRRLDHALHGQHHELGVPGVGGGLYHRAPAGHRPRRRGDVAGG